MIHKKLHEQLGKPPSYSLFAFGHDIILVPGGRGSKVFCKNYKLRAFIVTIPQELARHALYSRRGALFTHVLKHVPIILNVPVCYVVEGILSKEFTRLTTYSLARPVLGTVFIAREIMPDPR
jgi:hypothetical protein